MRIAIIADIHANLEALEAVLAHVDAHGADAVYCLGDVVGYGPDPQPCLERVRTRCAGVVLGNHDLAVGGGIGLRHLPPDGQAAARYHRDALDADALDYLAGLPLVIEAAGCTFVHATPQQPEAWLRIGASLNLARKQFKHFDTPVCFTGHTHQPGVIADRVGVLRVKPGNRYLVNVGSVGQPRDGNPRACVAYFEPDTFDYELVRVPYDVERTVQKIADAGLPETLGRRLRMGQ